MDNQQLANFLASAGVLVDIHRPEEWQQTGLVKGSLLLTFFLPKMAAVTLRSGRKCLI
jgi:hypothetical protein